MTKSKEAAELAVKLLNEAFDADPAAIISLIQNRVPCNFELSEHPLITVKEDSSTGIPIYSVGAFGLVIGIVEALTGHKVAYKVDEETEVLTGFCLYQQG